MVDDHSNVFSHSFITFKLYYNIFFCIDCFALQKQHQCEVGASAKKRIGKVQSEIQKAVASLKKVIIDEYNFSVLFSINCSKIMIIRKYCQVVKEFMDIPRVLVTETMQEGVGLVSMQVVVLC